MALDRLRASLAESPIVRLGEYEYFVHPITDGIPLGRPEVLDEVLSELVRIGDWNRCDKIVTAESMGFPLAAGLSMRVHKPYVFVRKRQDGLAGEVSLKQTTGYSRTDTRTMTTTITEKSVSRITSAFRADRATISPTSPRGVMPQPTDAASWRDIFESHAGIPQPTTFVTIARNVRTAPKRRSCELPTAAGRSTYRPREMKKIGVKTAPR